MKKRIKVFLEEFKSFASRGNVIDMAVGMIIGSAFTAIVTSLVQDVFTPIIGIITGGIDFSNLNLTYGEAQINIGNFINSIISFILVALIAFIMVKAFNSFKKKEEEKPVEAPKESDEVILLREIRDLIKDGK